jgi:hypothetical protein
MDDDKTDLSPDAVVVDLVLRYSADELRPNSFIFCAVPTDITKRTVAILATNHRDERVQVMFGFHLDGEPCDEPLRVVMYKLGPTVWKTAPSLRVPGMLHACLTFVDVPEPAPWEQS